MARAIASLIGPPRRTIFVLPVQTIALPWSADDPLRVLIDSGVVVNLGGIFFLRLNKATANLDCIQFIGSDAPQENLIAAFLGIEIPLSAFLYYRNRKRPAIIAN